MKKLDAEVIGVHQVNSVDFVKSAFRVYNSGAVLAILKESNSVLDLKKEVTPKPGGGWLDIHQDVIEDDQPAQIVFTSGTEGAPKTILLSHRALADVVIRLNKVMKVDATIREYVGIPVTYSFGFGRCRAVAAAGGRCFIPEKGFNPVEISRMLATDEINAISAVPTLWRTLLVQPDVIGELGQKVKWIEIGSQYMSRQEKEKMKALFPNAVIVQHYGLTEASRTTFLEIHKAEGELLESVGQPLGEVETKISSDGLIMVRGPHTASGRIIGNEIISLVDTDGWFTTGDFGRIENDNLYYGGRADDLINCAGIKVNPDLLQERINRRLNLENKIAVCKIDDELRGDGFFIAIEVGTTIDSKKLEDNVSAELLTLGISAKSSIKIQEVAGIPRTDTGKVKRKELAKLFIPAKIEKKEGFKPSDNRSVYEIFSRIFHGIDIMPSDTFRGLGGDSLNYVQMLLLLEDRFGHAPANWDTMTVDSLEEVQRTAKPTLYGWVDTSLFLRAIAILAVVATHSGDELIGGGTLLLFALIGYNMARFKAKDFFSGKIWKWMMVYLLIILIPYYSVTALYQGWGGELELDQIFLYSNLVARKITVIFPFWFVQVLIQCMILTGIIFSISSLRRFASKDPFKVSVLILICLVAVHQIYPFLWHTAYLNNLVPPRFMAILWLGWTLYFATTLLQRLFICVLGIGFSFLDTGLTITTAWLMLASIFLPFIPRVSVPLFAKKVISNVGAATFYIFSVNGLIISLLAHIVDINSVLIVFLVTMTISMMIWWGMERMQLIHRIQSTLNAMLKNT